MKHMICILMIVFLLPICASAENDLYFDGFKEYQTEHFTFSVPSGWIEQASDTGLGYSTNPYIEYYGMSMNMSEQDYTSFKSVGESAIYDFLEAGMMSAFGDDTEYSVFNSEHNGTPVRYIQLSKEFDDIILNSAVALYCVDGYNLTCLTTSVADTPEELLLNTQAIMKEVYFTENPPSSTSPEQLSDSDYILVGADQVYGNNLIEAWIRHSSGYIFIKAKESGDSDSIRTSTMYNASKMLNNLQQMAKDKHVEFEKVFFETHANLVDVYGNESTNCVLSFWLDYETVMKINFENFLYTNIKKIATDWYEHSSMRE